MEQALLVHEEKVMVNGRKCRISLYHRGDAKFYALTQFSTYDAFICDGFSVEDVLIKQRRLMPLAISCRQSLRKGMVNNA